jgi:hypothetical protein
MAAAKTIAQDVLVRESKNISANLKVADKRSALRVKMLSVQIDSQFGALESLLAAGHESIMGALKPSDKSSSWVKKGCT